MKQTRAKVMEILRDWAESELKSSCNDLGCGADDLIIDLAPLADRLIETLERVA